MVLNIFNRLLQLCLQVNLARILRGQSLNCQMWVDVYEVNGLYSFLCPSLSAFGGLILTFVRLWVVTLPVSTLFSLVCVWLCFLFFIKNHFASLYKVICWFVVVVVAVHFVVICSFIFGFSLV